MGFWKGMLSFLKVGSGSNLFEIEADGSDIRHGDATVGDVLVTFADAHVELNMMGSRQEYVK